MKLALVGYGRMGREVAALAEGLGHEVVARLDSAEEVRAGAASALSGAEVAIDFTVPDAVVDNVAVLAKAGLDLVIGTTGWYDRVAEVREAVDATGVGLVYAPNFSLGTYVLLQAARSLGRLLDPLREYDVHVLEEHHRRKLDHPSGTAIRLAETLVDALARKHAWTPGPPDGVADPATIWVSSVRAGEIPGTHEVVAEGPHDRLVLRHEARSRGGFAFGAVAAAEWVRGRKGVFTLEDFMADRLGPADAESGP
ncbi:MAG TPA: 4-hydroxy-tetrahydrodipicolinate reductase [Longimicrobiales bacterium]